MAEQINVFIENKPGRLTSITKLLSDKDINLRAVVIQDRGDCGIMKMLVDDPQTALLTLNGAGFACAAKNVLAIVIEDKPGGLGRLTQILSENSVNVLDAYGFVVESRKEAVWVVEVGEPDKVKGIVEKNGFRVLTDAELYDL
jgi:hypothetical protein